jgi:uncharacterized protein DUF4136
MLPTVWFGRCVAATSAALLLSGCAMARVSSYLEPGTNLQRYRTYTWEMTDRFATGDPRLDNNEIFQRYVYAAVDREMTARGFVKAPGGSPDLLLHLHASIEQRLDISATSQGETEDERVMPYVYDAGTLVIDLVDAQTERLVWRGWSERSMDGIIENQALLEHRIDKSVTEIFERLPGV